MKRLQKLRAVLKSRRGFTLIEVLLGMTISTILMLGITVVISTIHLNYVAGIELAYNRVMATNIADAVKDQIIVSHVTECTDTKIKYLTEFGEKTITGTNPHIEGLTYDPNYYMGKTVTLTFTKPTVPADPIYTITVSVKSNVGPSKTAYVLTRSVRLLNTP